MFRITAIAADGLLEFEEFCGSRNSADAMLGNVFRAYPDSEVKLWEGDVLLISAGPRTCAAAERWFQQICK